MEESPTWRGFEDGTNWILSDGPFEEYFKPPEGTPGCEGCTSEYVQPENGCPRCGYVREFTEASWK